MNFLSLNIFEDRLNQNKDIQYYLNKKKFVNNHLKINNIHNPQFLNLIKEFNENFDFGTEKYQKPFRSVGIICDYFLHGTII
jgi:hypothetical protein